MKTKKFQLKNYDTGETFTLRSDTTYELNDAGTKLVETNKTSKTNGDLFRFDLGKKGIIFSQTRNYYDDGAQDFITEYVRTYMSGRFTYNKRTGLLKNSRRDQEAGLTLFRPEGSDTADWDSYNDMDGEFNGVEDPVIGDIFIIPKSDRKQFKGKGALLGTLADEIYERYPNPANSPYIHKGISYQENNPYNPNTPGTTIQDFREFGDRNVFYDGFEDNLLTDDFFA